MKLTIEVEVTQDEVTALAQDFIAQGNPVQENGITYVDQVLARRNLQAVCQRTAKISLSGQDHVWDEHPGWKEVALGETPFWRRRDNDVVLEVWDGGILDDYQWMVSTGRGAAHRGRASSCTVAKQQADSAAKIILAMAEDMPARLGTEKPKVDRNLTVYDAPHSDREARYILLLMLEQNPSDARCARYASMWGLYWCYRKQGMTVVDAWMAVLKESLGVK